MIWLAENWDNIMTVMNAIGLVLVGKVARKGR